ncbi:MAG: hypothetical protein A2Y15_04335 [Clostridiales bacterium GWF2_36_10]|nr:MAG: hypothetical protein A2Y15_04335 [Clostridiales bacterium GWF2_36_10]HAN20480.1 hypothetical protein [Clostridiales bacterium]
MKINWIGQSGYLLDDGETRILIDPYLSDIVNKVANRPRMVDPLFMAKDFKGDAIICTHDHLDHLDPEAIKDFDKKMLFIAPLSCEQKLKELECNNIALLNIGDSIEVGKFNFTAVFANHSIEAIGVLLEWDGYILYFTSDTLYHKKLEDMRKYKPDIMFVCINGKLGNMNVEEAVELTEIVNPRVGIPSHYGMFESNTENPGKYTSKLKNSFEMEQNKFYHINEILGGRK